jgi:hypothetical protein
MMATRGQHGLGDAEAGECASGRPRCRQFEMKRWGTEREAATSVGLARQWRNFGNEGAFSPPSRHEARSDVGAAQRAGAAR